MKKIKRVWLAGILGIAILLGPQGEPLRAGETELTPAITLRGEYDDNIDFTRENKIDDFVWSISPSLTWNYGTDKLKINSRAGATVRRYTDESDLDDEMYSLSLGAAFQATERLGLTANAGYIRDTTLDSYLEETGRVMEREDRKLLTAGGGLAFAMTERMNTGLNYGFRKADYDRPASEDYTAHTFSGFLGYKLKSQVDTLFLSPSYSWTDLETKDIDTYSVSLAWERKMSEIYKIRASAGYRWSEQKYDGVSGKDRSNGMIADISLTRQGQLSSVTVGYARDLAVGTQGELDQVDRFYAQLGYKLMERLTANLNGSLYFAKKQNERAIRDNDSTFWSVSPSLSYQLTENFFLTTGYRYAHNKEDWYDGSAERNMVWLALSFQMPRKW